MATPEQRTIPVAGGALAVLIDGADDPTLPVLCEAPHPVVPGVTAPCTPLTGLGRVVRPSPRGAGDSASWRGPKDASVGALAADLEAVRAGLGLGPWVVVGHSAGSFVAMEYARRYPAAAAGLVLVAPSLGLRPVYADPRSRNSARHPRWRAELAAHPPPPAPADAFRVVRVRDGLWVALEGDHPLVPLPTAELPAPLPARLEATLAFDAGPWVGGLRAPTLVVGGGADDVVPLPHVEAVAAGLPGAELAVFEASGHAPFAHEPGRFRVAVAAFLARRLARG